MRTVNSHPGWILQVSCDFSLHMIQMSLLFFFSWCLCCFSSPAHPLNLISVIFTTQLHHIIDETLVRPLCIVYRWCCRYYYLNLRWWSSDRVCHSEWALKTPISSVGQLTAWFILWWDCWEMMKSRWWDLVRGSWWHKVDNGRIYSLHSSSLPQSAFCPARTEFNSPQVAIMVFSLTGDRKPQSQVILDNKLWIS